MSLQTHFTRDVIQENFKNIGDMIQNILTKKKQKFITIFNYFSHIFLEGQGEEILINFKNIGNTIQNILRKEKQKCC